MFGFASGIMKNTAATRRQPDSGAAYVDAAGLCADVEMSGFTSGMRLATNLGWRPVEAITVGDHVLTFDHGMQPVVAVTRGVFFAAGDVCPDHARPIEVPAGALGNETAMLLLPEASVMIESDVAEELFGDPFTLVPARALVGWRGIARRAMPRPVEIITLHCAADQVVYADGGALVLCPTAVPGVATLDALDESWAPVIYPVLDRIRAEALIDFLAEADRAAFDPAQTGASRAA